MKKKYKILLTAMLAVGALYKIAFSAASIVGSSGVLQDHLRINYQTTVVTPLIMELYPATGLAFASILFDGSKNTTDYAYGEISVYDYDTTTRLMTFEVTDTSTGESSTFGETDDSGSNIIVLRHQINCATTGCVGAIPADEINKIPVVLEIISYTGNNEDLLANPSNPANDVGVYSQIQNTLSFTYTRPRTDTTVGTALKTSNIKLRARLANNYIGIPTPGKYTGQFTIAASID